MSINVRVLPRVGVRFEPGAGLAGELTSGVLSAELDYATVADGTPADTDRIILQDDDGTFKGMSYGDFSAPVINAAVVAAGVEAQSTYDEAIAASGHMFFYTVTTASAAEVPAGVKAVTIIDATDANGGVMHTRERVASEPASGPKHRSADRFLPDGSSSSSNGGWWGLVTDAVVPQIWADRGIQQVVTGDAFASSAFYTFLTQNDFLSTETDTHLDTRATMTVTRRATGSGYQSMGASDIGLIVSSEKSSYLTSTVVGEVNGLFVIMRNGRKSDGAGILVDVTKVTTGDSNTDGGSLGFEMSSRVVNTSGDLQNLGQVLIGWYADERILGQGYRFHGCVMQSRKGDNHAAYMVNSIQPYGSPSNWKYAFLASSAQEQVTQFYAVGGDGNEKPGAVYLGPADELMALWYDETADALKFMSGKVVNADNSTAVGSVNLLAAQLGKDGDLFVRQSLQISTGALLKKMLRGVYTINPGVITAQNAYSVTQTLTGVSASDEITVTLGTGYSTDKIHAIARYTGTDQITIYVMNYGSASTSSLSSLVCYVTARGY
jgi:hypothetical protein